MGAPVPGMGLPQPWFGMVAGAKSMHPSLNKVPKTYSEAKTTKLEILSTGAAKIYAIMAYFGTTVTEMGLPHPWFGMVAVGLSTEPPLNKAPKTHAEAKTTKFEIFPSGAAKIYAIMAYFGCTSAWNGASPAIVWNGCRWPIYRASTEQSSQNIF